MTSMISLFVLVLATYCYSLPLQDQFQSSTFTTPIQEYSTGVTIVEHAVKVNMRLISPEESNDIPNIHSEHKYDEHHSEHMPTDEVSHPTQLAEEMSSRFTTQSPFSSHSKREEVSRSSRVAGEMSSVFTTQSPFSSHSKRDELSLNEFTTMESQTTFDERSMNNYREHSLEMSTVAGPLASASFDLHARELTTSSEVRPQEFTTSADSFGKFTGLLNNDETTEAMRFEPTTEAMRFEQTTEAMRFEPTTEAMKFEHSTTAMKSGKDDSSMEETTEKPQQLIKTISVIPGKITTTQIFSNEAGKAYFMRQPEQQQQLTQGQKQSIVKTQKSDY